MSRFLTSLQTEDIDDGNARLLSPLKYESDILDSLIIVPAGFVTDFASVPRVPIAYMLFGDRAHHESVVHDWCYQRHICTKSQADKIFLEAMVVRKKPRYIRWPMYWAVALAGWSSYKSGPERYKKINGGKQ